MASQNPYPISSNQTEIYKKMTCRSKYGKRSFWKLGEERLPPVLYTFPGSGNTWCRLLIEYGTGIYSGQKNINVGLLYINIERNYNFLCLFSCSS